MILRCFGCGKKLWLVTEGLPYCPRPAPSHLSSLRQAQRTRTGTLPLHLPAPCSPLSPPLWTPQSWQCFRKIRGGVGCVFFFRYFESLYFKNCWTYQNEHGSIRSSSAPFFIVLTASKRKRFYFHPFFIYSIYIPFLIRITAPLFSFFVKTAIMNEVQIPIKYVSFFNYPWIKRFACLFGTKWKLLKVPSLRQI